MFMSTFINVRINGKCMIIIGNYFTFCVFIPCFPNMRHWSTQFRTSPAITTRHFGHGLHLPAAKCQIWVEISVFEWDSYREHAWHVTSDVSIGRLKTAPTLQRFFSCKPIRMPWMLEDCEVLNCPCNPRNRGWITNFHFVPMYVLVSFCCMSQGSPRRSRLGEQSSTCANVEGNSWGPH